MFLHQEICNYMYSIKQDHTDPITGEISMTGLAEDAADEFGVDTEEIPDVFFEVAFVVAEESTASGWRMPVTPEQYALEDMRDEWGAREDYWQEIAAEHIDPEDRIDPEWFQIDLVLRNWERDIAGTDCQFQWNNKAVRILDEWRKKKRYTAHQEYYDWEIPF